MRSIRTNAKSQVRPQGLGGVNNFKGRKSGRTERDSTKAFGFWGSLGEKIMPWLLGWLAKAFLGNLPLFSAKRRKK